MGVRLVIHNYLHDSGAYIGGTHNHDDLLHRDYRDQHPIYAISGLQEVLNAIETSISDLLNSLPAREQVLKDYSDNNRKEIEERIDNLNIIKKVNDTGSIDLDYDEDEKTLQGNVRIYDDPQKTNNMVSTPYGLYAQKPTTKDTDSITWYSFLRTESLKELFDNGIRFSHNDTENYNNLKEPNDANGWMWDTTKNTIKQPLTSTTYNGIVSKELYDSYELLATLKSDGTENNANGIVLGYIYDDNNHVHTLSVMLQKGGDLHLSYRFAIIYNFRLPDETLVMSYNLQNYQNGWDKVPNGITLYINKNENKFKVSSSVWGYNNQITDIENANAIPFEHTFDIDLNNYAWGSYFKDKVHYGYSNLAQPESYITNIIFQSNSYRSPKDLLAKVKISKETNNEIKVNEDGIYAPKFIISEDENNGLEKRENGYFVERTPMAVSTDPDNGLTQDDGVYFVHQPHSFVKVDQIDHGLEVGDFIYFFNGNDTYKKALAKDDFDINVVGMVTRVFDVNTFEYVCSGFVKTDLFTSKNGYVQGMPIYISDKEPGKVTQTQPDISKAVGYPVEEKGLIISIERGIQYQTEASIGDFKKSASTYNIRSDGFIKVRENIEYKLNLMQKLLNVLTQDFINKYIITDEGNNTLEFKDINELYKVQDLDSTDESINLYIKAF